MLSTKSDVFLFFLMHGLNKRHQWLGCSLAAASFQPLGPSKLHHLESTALQYPASHTPNPPTILIYLKFSGIAKISQTH